MNEKKEGKHYKEEIKTTITVKPGGKETLIHKDEVKSRKNILLSILLTILFTVIGLLIGGIFGAAIAATLSIVGIFKLGPAIKEKITKDTERF